MELIWQQQMNKNIQCISKQVDWKHLLNKATRKSELQEPDIVLCTAQGDFDNWFILQCQITLEFGVFPTFAWTFSFFSSSDLRYSKITFNMLWEDVQISASSWARSWGTDVMSSRNGIWRWRRYHTESHMMLDSSE